MSSLLQLLKQLPSDWQSAIFSAIAGDALGVPHEFKTAANIPHPSQVDMWMPADYPKTYAHIPYGTWSDDASQMMALLDSLLASGGSYDARSFIDRLLAWYRHGHYQAGGVVFDCGLQTSAALEGWEAGQAMSVSGNQMRCGNGSLMRVLPVAMLPDHYGVSRRDAVLVAMAQSVVTHPQPIAQLCCGAYVELCWLVQAGMPCTRDTGRLAFEALADRGVLTDACMDVYPVALAGMGEMPTGSGYVLSTFWTAIWAVQQSTSVSEALRMAVSFGGDTDTLACVAGGVAGLAFGLDAQTRGWLSGMTLDMTCVCQ